MSQSQVFLDTVDRIKGLLKPEAAPQFDVNPGNAYPNPALLIPVQAYEIQVAYQAALEMPISFSRRPHLVLALVLYRFGYNCKSTYNATSLAEWVLTSYKQAHPEHGPEGKGIPPSPKPD